MRLRSILCRSSITLILVLGVLACRQEEEPARRPGEPEGAAAERPQPAFAAVTDEMLREAEASGEDWLVYGGSYNNQRYSTLDQINRDNVEELAPAWSYQTGIAESFETTPIVVGNTMYLTTPGSQVIALNAATGEKLWQYVPRLGTTIFCCGPNNRGVAAYRDKVYVGTLDARLIALNNRTGQVVWEAQVDDPTAGYSITQAPLAYRGKVLTGIGGGEYGIRGHLTAYDAETGRQLWRWYAVPAPNEAPNGWWGEWKTTDPWGTPLNRNIAQEKADSARYADAWRTGGAAVWMTPAYDPETNTIYANVGNPSPDLDGSIRPGDNLYSESIVALDGDTGRMKWYFQYLPHDVWDLDAASPPILFTVDGRKYVGHAGKTGWYYVVDAATGRPILRSQNFVPHENLFAPPTPEGVRMLPGANGGSEWSPTAFSPRTNLVYVLGLHQPMEYTTHSVPYEKGRLWLGSAFTAIPGEEQWGLFSAIDVRNGEIKWNRQVPVPMMGAALATAGDLVFVGQGTGVFDAFDAETGELLWQFPMGAGVHGGPITYMLDGVQYVAVAAGGIFQINTPRGDALHAFALPERRPAVPGVPYGRPTFRPGRAERFEEGRQQPAPGGQPGQQRQGRPQQR